MSSAPLGISDLDYTCHLSNDLLRERVGQATFTLHYFSFSEMGTGLGAQVSEMVPQLLLKPQF